MAGEIFISYRRADVAWARLLHGQLRAQGVEAWYDALVGPGEDWRIATAKALENSQIFVLLFSENAAQSSDIAKELAAAVLEKKLIVPVRLQNIAPKGAFLYELASRNWINAYDEPEAKLAELAKGLAPLVRTGRRDENALPFGQPQDGGSNAASIRRRTGNVVAACAAMALAALAGGVYWHYAGPTRPPGPSSAMRVAVLPFEALSGNSDAGTFAKAVAEQIIATFNDIQVQTLSAADAQPLKGSDRDAVAEKLNTEFILSGSVLGGERDLHVTVHLDHTLTHATVWTASYDQKGASALEFQSQIAAIAADVVKHALEARRDNPGKIDDAALGIILKLAAGNHTLTREGLLETLDQARQLTARLPKYSFGYSAQAVSDALLMNSAMPGEIDSLRADARNSAAQALALNPKDPQAYVALSLLVPNGRWAEKEETLRKGLAQAPNDATLQNYLAGMLAGVGRMREALALFTTSRMLDPLSPPKNASLAVALFSTGRVAESISTINRAGDTWPSSGAVWLARFIILANSGHEDEAAALLASAQSHSINIEPRALAARRAYLQALRDKSQTAAATNAIRSAVSTGDIDKTQGMQMLAKLGDTDSAFALAENLFAGLSAQRAPVATGSLFQAATDSMRRDRRFLPLAAKAGLLDYWRKTGKWPDFCADPDLPYNCRTETSASKPSGRP